ncbi:MAG: hypothetical protein COA43_08090 [Robiginitomaculum sp.]|nr:MAG: hypothetical protein COA43_08090 [Robiginitomaculum sp.]
MGMKHLNQFSKLRKGRWYYVRRVPNLYAHLDNRLTIKSALKTGSIEVARKRRDCLVEADEQYWANLSIANDNVAGTSSKIVSSAALSRYRAAKPRYVSLGTYPPLLPT